MNALLRLLAAILGAHIGQDEVPASEVVERLEFPDLGGVTVEEAGEVLRRNLTAALADAARPCWACGNPLGFHAFHLPCWRTAGSPLQPRAPWERPTPVGDGSVT